MSEATLIKKIKLWDKAYAQGEPLVSDKFYDKMKAKLGKSEKDLAPNTAYTAGEKVKLPSIMGKMHKISPTKLSNFVREKEQFYLIDPKFDGVSLKLIYANGRLIDAFTRGDGKIGRRRLHLAKHVNGVIPVLNEKISGEVDGEIIVTRTNFKKHFKNVGKKPYKNERNLAAGVFNRINPDKDWVERLRYMTFIAFRGEFTKKKFKTKSGQLNFLYDLGFPTALNPRPWSNKVYEKVHSSNGKYTKWDVFSSFIKLGQTTFLGKDIDETMIIDLLQRWKATLDILLDGLIIEHESLAKQRKLGYDGLYPEFARAIKLDVENQESRIAKVTKITSEISARGIYKPVAVISPPAVFDGVEVTNITLHNYAHVKKQKIGPGAKIKIIRSGDVIPRFMKTVTPAEKIVVPKRCRHCDSKLEWTDTKTDLYCPNTTCEGFLAEKTIEFFTKLKIEGLKHGGIVKKLINEGYNTPRKICNIKPSKLAEIEGLGIKSATKICNNLQKTQPTIPEIMWASGIFSTNMSALGPVRAGMLYKAVGNKLFDGEIDASLRRKILQIDGIGPTLADIFIERLPDFRTFYKALPMKATEISENGPLSGQSFAFTGYRDKEQERFIIKNGGGIGGVTKKTTVLFCATPGSPKAKSAEAKGVKIVNQEDAWKYLETLVPNS